jgi:hypothetical protein
VLVLLKLPRILDTTTAAVLRSTTPSQELMESLQRERRYSA